MDDWLVSFFVGRGMNMRQARICAAITENPGKLTGQDLISHVWPDEEPYDATEMIGRALLQIRKKERRTGVSVPKIYRRNRRFSIVIRWPRDNR